MTLELFVVTDGFNIDESVDYPLIVINADERDDSRRFQINLRDSSVSLPLEIVKDMIEAAEVDVHSERWFEQNVFNRIENHTEDGRTDSID